MGLQRAHGFAQHDLEVKRKHIARALLRGLYRNRTRAVLGNQLPHPVRGALIGGQTSQSAPLELALRQSPFYGHRKLAARTEQQLGPVPAVCTEEGILPRVCGLKQTHVTKPQIFAFNDILDCKLNVTTQAALQVACPSAKH